MAVVTSPIAHTEPQQANMTVSQGEKPHAAAHKAMQIHEPQHRSEMATDRRAHFQKTDSLVMLHHLSRRPPGEETRRAADVPNV